MLNNTKRNSTLLLILLCTAASCSIFNGMEKKLRSIDNAKTLRSFTSVADMNDAFFVLKENNYFDFYRQLFDSVKNSRYPGTYTTLGDTLYLHFFDKKGAEILGNKAVLRSDDIIFLK